LIGSGSKNPRQVRPFPSRRSGWVPDRRGPAIPSAAPPRYVAEFDFRSDKAAKELRAADQIKTFRKAAHELGADEDERRFKEMLRTIAKP